MTSQEVTRRSREPEPPLILIADDEEPITEMLEAFVTDLGYTPLVARNGQQALNLARERWPALVVTDLMMPIVSGADLITALSAEAEASGRASPPIVLLTAGSARAVSHLHVDAMLSKPFDLGKLERVIHQLLGPK
jgi:two-component system, chemotaxis family, chemotaxis protein CheY